MCNLVTVITGLNSLNAGYQNQNFYSTPSTTHVPPINYATVPTGLNSVNFQNNQNIYSTQTVTTPNPPLSARPSFHPQQVKRGFQIFNHLNRLHTGRT